MDIEKKRAEILRLIAKVNRDEAGGVRSTPRSDGGPARPRATQRAASAPRPAQPTAVAASRPPAPATESARSERRHQLAELRALRQRLESRSPDHEVLELLRALDQRVAAIEELLREGVAELPAGRAAPTPLASADHAFSGVLREGLLADMLQLVSSNMMSGEFVIEGEGLRVSLYFSEGEICHGEGPEMTGESAVFGAMALEQGRYYFRETTELPAQRTIESKTQFLILEALRRVDEDRAQ